jgi:hypothetical protein
MMLATVAGDEHRTADEVLLDALRLADTAMITEPSVETVRLAAQLASEAVKIGAAGRQAEAMARPSVAVASSLDQLVEVGRVLDQVLAAAFPDRPEMTMWARSVAANIIVGDPFPHHRNHGWRSPQDPLCSRSTSSGYQRTRPVRSSPQAAAQSR